MVSKEVLEELKKQRMYFVHETNNALSSITNSRLLLERKLNKGSLSDEDVLKHIDTCKTNTKRISDANDLFYEQLEVLIKKRFVLLFMLLSFGFGIYSQHKNNWLTTDTLEVNPEKEIEKLIAKIYKRNTIT